MGCGEGAIHDGLYLSNLQIADSKHLTPGRGVWREASVTIATSELLGPRPGASNKQLFRVVKKWSKARKEKKNGKRARSNLTSATSHTPKTKLRSWEWNLPITLQERRWLPAGLHLKQKAPLTGTSVITKHLGINIFLKIFFFLWL